jgi:CheY-like chemotaxis protein
MIEKNNLKNDGTQILIAEDSPVQAEELKNLLEKSNYKVIVAKDGKEALQLVIKHNPSLVISDIVMPEMNGYELCKEIKSNEKTKDIPVILLTSLTSSEDVLEGISCGADNYITKPYKENYLISCIEHILINKEIYKREIMTFNM